MTITKAASKITFTIESVFFLKFMFHRNKHDSAMLLLYFTVLSDGVSV